MKDIILIGRQETIHEVPAEVWRQHLAAAQHHTPAAFSFMTHNHHRVRNFVVMELPRNHGKPLKPADIARALNLPHSLISTILEDLEKHLFFLVRTPDGEISWAFPVTCDPTPHRLSFNTGERIFAA